MKTSREEMKLRFPWKIAFFYSLAIFLSPPKRSCERKKLTRNRWNLNIIAIDRTNVLRSMEYN